MYDSLLQERKRKRELERETKKQEKQKEMEQRKVRLGLSNLNFASLPCLLMSNVHAFSAVNSSSLLSSRLNSAH